MFRSVGLLLGQERVSCAKPGRLLSTLTFQYTVPWNSIALDNLCLFYFFTQAWYDGGFTDNQPVPPTGFTIRVSPFSGNSEICPRDESRVFSEMNWRNMHVYVNRENMRRARNILYPPRKRLLAQLYGNGFNDALQYIKESRLA